MNPIMPWIDTLDSVEETDFPERRDSIAVLVQQAADSPSNSATLLAEAYVKACMLEGDAKARWSAGEIERAKRESTDFL